ncbi:hypothetical protein BDI4_670043 [Burkholderia diffusa]|nr:hypothetical protein BDI4_670043 [Burkholderia diffusa]
MKRDLELIKRAVRASAQHIFCRFSGQWARGAFLQAPRSTRVWGGRWCLAGVSVSR